MSMRRACVSWRRVAPAAGELHGQHRPAGRVGVDRDRPVEPRVARCAEAPDQRVVELACLAPDRPVVETERREAVGERAHRVDLAQHLPGCLPIAIHDLDERAGHVVGLHFACLLSFVRFRERIVARGGKRGNRAALCLEVRLSVPLPRARARPSGGALRDRRRARREPDRLLAGGGRRARARPRVAGGGGAPGRGRRGREPLRTWLGAWHVWTGSHLDTVPQGGKFDGALGVVAAIEAVERTGRGTVAIFRDEERGCAGSRRSSLRGAVSFRERSSSCTSSRARASPTPTCRSAIVSAIVGYARGRGHRRGTGGPCRNDADGRCATTRW